MNKTVLFKSVLMLLFFSSCIDRPEAMHTDKISEANGQVDFLINYEKQNRKEKDTVLLDLVLGSSKKQVKLEIEKLIQNGLIKKDGYNYTIEFENLPMLNFNTIYFHDRLQIIMLTCSEISENNNEDLTYSLEKNYGQSDVYYLNEEYGKYIKEYWVKGDLLIKKEASFKYFTDAMGYETSTIKGVDVKISYSKLSIKEESDKEIENAIQREEDKEIKKRIKQRDKEDSIARYF